MRVPVHHVGQILGPDHRLMPLHPRHMRVAEQRDAVRVERHDLPDGGGQLLLPLAGQAVDRVDVERAHAVAPEAFDDAARLFNGLDAVDRRLHGRVEILHADADARQPRFGQRVDARVVHAARVDLDGEFELDAQPEPIRDPLDQPLAVVGAEDRRRAAAPMQVRDPRGRRHGRRDQVDLGMQRLQIVGDRLVLPGDLGVAAAEPAPACRRRARARRAIATRSAAVSAASADTSRRPRRHGNAARSGSSCNAVQVARRGGGSSRGTGSWTVVLASPIHRPCRGYPP